MSWVPLRQVRREIETTGLVEAAEMPRDSLRSLDDLKALTVGSMSLVLMPQGRRYNRMAI